MLTTRASLVQQLRQLGVTAGDRLMVHASLRRLGPVEGGTSGVLDALIEVLGSNGTLLMVLGADEDEPFDALTTPALEEMSALAEVLRRRPGVRVNDHAACRYAAIGVDAKQLLEPAHLDDYHGPGSVLDRLTALGGAVLRLGADVDTVTLTHWAEYLANLPNKRRVRRCYVRADIGEQWIECLDDNDGIFDWAEGDYFPQIFLDFVAAGGVSQAPVGHCTAEYFAARPFVAFAKEWLERHGSDTR